MSALEPQRQAAVHHIEVHAGFYQFPYALRAFVDQNIYGRIVAQSPPGDDGIFKMKGRSIVFVRYGCDAALGKIGIAFCYP